MDEIKPIKINKEMKVSELVGQMADAGFGARKIGRACQIAKKIFSEKKCAVFLGMAGAMVPAGMKQIIIDLVKEKKIDVLVTTGANLTHDLIEALGEKHFHCDLWNDREFHKKGFDRIYNVFMKNDVYEKLEDFFEKNWDKLCEAGNIKEFLSKIASLLPEDSNSILRACYDNNVHIYCPAIADSGIGLMVWGRAAGRKFKKINIDAFDDLKDIIDFAWKSEKKAVIYIGGGVPKNFIQQALQVSSGADYGIQITTDSPFPGGSSGAPLEEGKSWGKLKEDADEMNYADVYCDATIALPLIFADV